MIKLNNSNKLKAEITLRSLSDKAYEVYSDLSPLTVYEVNNKFYVKGALEYDELTFDELEQILSDMYDEFETSGEYGVMDKKPETKKSEAKFSATKQSTEYKNNFRDENYDRVEIVLPKGRKAVLKEKAKDNGTSVSGYIDSLF